LVARERLVRHDLQLHDRRIARPPETRPGNGL
jgi:hypothetical protein